MPNTGFHWSMSFTSLDHFARFARAFPFDVKMAEVAGRGAVAAFLTKEVKDRFGKPNLLPPPLKPSTVRDRVRQGFSPNETLLRTGHYRDSNSWGHVTPELTIVGSTDRIAPYHELEQGGPKTKVGWPPQRSTLAWTARDKDAEAFTLFCAIFSKEAQAFGTRAVMGANL